MHRTTRWLALSPGFANRPTLLLAFLDTVAVISTSGLLHGRSGCRSKFSWKTFNRDCGVRGCGGICESSVRAAQGVTSSIENTKQDTQLTPSSLGRHQAKVQSLIAGWCKKMVVQLRRKHPAALSLDVAATISLLFGDGISMGACLCRARQGSCFMFVAVQTFGVIARSQGQARVMIQHPSAKCMFCR